MKRKRTPKILSYSKFHLAGKRVILRPYRLSDFARCKLSHEGRLKPRDRFDEPIPTAMEKTPAKFKTRLVRYRRRAKESGRFVFGVFLKSSGEFVGQVDLFVINEQLSWVNLGYHIQNQHAGKGYATEAAELLLKAAFKPLGFHRVEAGMEAENAASLRVATKLGLTFEGKRTKFFPENGGVDLLIFGANAIDYRPRR